MSFFSAAEADALIPVLTPLVEELWQNRRALAIKLLEADPALRRARGRAGASIVERRDQARMAGGLRDEIVRAVGRIEAYGCIVKDVDLGLIDFPALRNGRPVFLCWKAGESAVTHWHGTDESFASRKPL